MLGPSNDRYMNKTWTIRLALALIVAGVLDLVSTYIVTPDLSGEGNPFMVVFGRNWVYVVLFKVVGSLLAVGAFAGGLHILQSRVDRLRGITGFVNVISHLVFKRRVSFGEFVLYGRFKDWPSAFAVAGITMGIVPITGGVTAAIFNTLKLIRSQAQLMVILFLTAALGVSISFWVTYQFLVKQRKAI
jgi:hypothetical protein